VTLIVAVALSLAPLALVGAVMWNETRKLRRQREQHERELADFHRTAQQAIARAKKGRS
jgi:uncharacterized iron-regulated membrane protein